MSHSAACPEGLITRGTLALVPQVVSAVTVPVIAAGGIADAKGVAVALALGAAAVQVGTAYYMFTPSLDESGDVSGAVAGKQGYLSVNGNSVTRPSIAVTSSGKVVIGVSLMPVSNPSVRRPSLKKPVFSQRRSMRSGSASMTSSAAMQAAATGGGADVENR